MKYGYVTWPSSASLSLLFSWILSSRDEATGASAHPGCPGRPQSGSSTLLPCDCPEGLYLTALPLRVWGASAVLPHLVDLAEPGSWGLFPTDLSGLAVSALQHNLSGAPHSQNCYEEARHEPCVSRARGASPHTPGSPSPPPWVGFLSAPQLLSRSFLGLELAVVSSVGTKSVIGLDPGMLPY